MQHEGDWRNKIQNYTLKLLNIQNSYAKIVKAIQKENEAMNKIKQYIKIIVFIIIVLMILITNKANAATLAATSLSVNKTASYEINTREEAIDTINSLLEAYSENGLTKGIIADAVSAYKEASKSFTNLEIVEIIEESKNTLEKQNIKVDNLDNVTSILKQFNETQLNNVLNKINLDDALNELEGGATLLQVIEKATENLSTSDKVDLVLSILRGANFVRILVILIIILTIYKLLVRCIILKKAGRKPWTVLIPIYNNVAMLKICEMSPWWMLLLLLPIIGWIILWLVNVASRFMLAATFDKGIGFAFGLWLLSPIFEGILAFSKNSKYIGIQE